MIIHKANGNLVQLIKDGVIVKSAVYKHIWQKEHSVKLEIKTRVSIDIERDDYVEYMGTRFYLHQDLKSIGTTSGVWQDLAVELYGPYMFLQRAQYKNVAVDQVRVRDDVPLTGNLYSLAQVVVNNLNRVYGAGLWSLGTYPVDTLPAAFSFNYDSNCLFVVNELCEKYGTYYTVTISAGVFVLNFGAVIVPFSHTLQYGLNAGLIEISLEAVSAISRVTRLQVFGSTKNLSTGYRDYASNRLMLPETYVHSEIEDADIIAEHGISESTVVNDEIYPHRIGTVSGIVEGDIFSFVDSSMPADIVVADGAQVAFLDGDLGGTVFDVAVYDSDAKKFTLVELSDANGFKKPNSSTAYQISTGDRYTLLGIIMPASYETSAEEELEAWGLAKYEELQQAKVTLNLSTSSIFLRSVNENIYAGQEAHVVYEQANIDKNIRVSEVERNILNGIYTSLKLSDYSVKNPVKAILKRIANIPSGDKGVPGMDSAFVNLGNYSQSVPCDSFGNASAAMTITIPFWAYRGSRRIACICTSPEVDETLVDGVTVESITDATDLADGSIVLSVTPGATFGSPAALSGIFAFVFNVAGEMMTLKFGWSKAVAGVTGTTGAVGKRITIGNVYYQSESEIAPAAPSATAFDFSTKTFTALSEGWLIEAPVYEVGSSKKYWLSYFNVEESASGSGTGVPVFGVPKQALYLYVRELQTLPDQNEAELFVGTKYLGDNPYSVIELSSGDSKFELKSDTYGGGYVAQSLKMLTKQPDGWWYQYIVSPEGILLTKYKWNSGVLSQYQHFVSYEGDKYGTYADTDPMAFYLKDKIKLAGLSGYADVSIGELFQDEVGRLFRKISATAPDAPIVRFGTAITGTVATPTTFESSGIAMSLAGDVYINTETGGVYKCITGGIPVYATWSYQGRPTYTASDVGAAATNHTHNQLTGVSEVTTLVSLPVTYRSISAVISTTAEGTISLASALAAGEELMLHIVASAAITVSFASSTNVTFMDTDTWNMASGDVLEVSIWCYKSGYYSVSSKIKE